MVDQAGDEVVAVVLDCAEAILLQYEVVCVLFLELAVDLNGFGEFQVGLRSFHAIGRGLHYELLGLGARVAVVNEVLACEEDFLERDGFVRMAPPRETHELLIFAQAEALNRVVYPLNQITIVSHVDQRLGVLPFHLHQTDVGLHALLKPWDSLGSDVDHVGVLKQQLLIPQLECLLINY